MIYKTIEGFSNYEIYETGMIISKDRISRDGKHLKRKEIHPVRTKNGYYTVRLCNSDGKIKQFYLHRLVYEAFYGDIGNLEVEHLDGNRANCAKFNIRAVNHKLNCSNQVSKERYRISNAADKGKYNHKRLLNARTKEYYNKLIETYYKLKREEGHVGVMRLMEVGHCGFYRAKRIIAEMKDKE